MRINCPELAPDRCVEIPAVRQRDTPGVDQEQSQVLFLMASDNNMSRESGDCSNITSAFHITVTGSLSYGFGL